MGWKVANAGSIAGDTGPLPIGYWWPSNNGNENKGAQFAEANPETLERFSRMDANGSL